MQPKVAPLELRWAKPRSANTLKTTRSLERSSRFVKKSLSQAGTGWGWEWPWSWAWQGSGSQLQIPFVLQPQKTASGGNEVTV